jgi:GNAT superfamily N-acetyltransferase
MKIEIGYTELGSKMVEIIKSFDLFETIEPDGNGEFSCDGNDEFAFAEGEGGEWDIIGVLWYEVDEATISIKTLQVLPASQGKGVGTAFIKALRSEFPYKSIRASNVTANARQWYENRGFVKDRDSMWDGDYILD